MQTFNKVYAIPDFNVKAVDYDKYLIDREHLQQAHDAGRTIAVRLEETDYGVLDFDAHSTTTGIALYDTLKAKYPDFFNGTRTEQTGNGGIHVYFNKFGKVNQNALRQRGEVDVFDGYSPRWMVIGESKFKNGKPAEYRTTINGAVLDLPDELKGLLLTKAKPQPTGETTDMPKPVKPLDVEMPIYGVPADLGWSEASTGRNDRLFNLVVNAYRHGTGKPTQRMAKALWLAGQVLETIPTNEAKYSSLEAWWNFNKTLGIILATDQQEQAELKTRMNRPTVLPTFKPIEWQPGGVLAKGYITGCVAPTKTSKTTFAFGHLVKDAAKHMRLIVISDETSWLGVQTYAHEHGYSHTQIDCYSSRDMEAEGVTDPYWITRRKYVMNQPGLFTMIEAALELDDGTPAVIVIENPEAFISVADVGKEGFIGNSENLQASAYKHFVTRLESSLLSPGGHSLVWITHSQANGDNVGPRGGRAGIERFRMLYQLSGSITEQVYITNRSNWHTEASPIGKYALHVQETSFEAQQLAAKDFGVPVTSADIPRMVYAGMSDPDALGIYDLDIDDLELDKPMRAGAILDALKINYTGKDASRKLKSLEPELRRSGISLVKVSDRLYAIRKVTN